MKKLTKILIAFSFMLFIGNAVSAQTSAQADVLATIKGPIIITMQKTMDFGVIGAAPLIASTAVLTPGGVISDPATNLTFWGGQQVASFTITGTSTFLYTITILGADGNSGTLVTLQNATTSDQMTADTWTSLPDWKSALNTIPGTGTQTLTVGGTLHVGAAQAPGNYSTDNMSTGDPITVTVAYQ